MISESQVRQRLASYLSQEISLNEFEDWLVQRSWNMHDDSSGAAQKLVAAIELRLAEYSSGHLNAEQLRAEFLPFVSSYSIDVSFGEAPQLSLGFSDRIDHHKWIIEASSSWSLAAPDPDPLVHYA